MTDSPLSKVYYPLDGRTTAFVPGYRPPGVSVSEEAPVAGDPLRFYCVDDAHGAFSNLAPFPLRLRDRTWPTSEHYFQAQKVAGTPNEAELRGATSPMIAARMGRSRKRPLRKDWEPVKDGIMLPALRARFGQHPNLKQLLLGTGDATLVEHTSKDRYWADGGDGTGLNRLGLLPMQVRSRP
jgi:ribA/ribD-fused uncharacterized protein